MSQTIRDIMTKDVQTAASDTPIKEVAQIMKSRDIGSLPVCEGRKVIGLITDRDIAIRGVAEGRDLDSTRVSDLMSKDVVSVREDSDLEEAKRLMHDRQLRRLPVLDAEGNIAGYLALARIARAESPEEAGKVIKGVSQSSAPASMESYEQKKRQKTG